MFSLGVFLSVFSLDVFSLCFSLNVFSPCSLSMFSLHMFFQCVLSMCSLHVFSQFFSILFQVSAHVGSGNNSGSRGLLNEKALVLGFHVTEEEARQLVQEGCGRGGSRTGSRGYLSVEDFVYVPIAVVYMYVW